MSTLRGDEWTTFMRSMPRSLPRSVAGPLERLWRELSYLKPLLKLERRNDEWGHVESLVGGVLAHASMGAFDRAAEEVAMVEQALSPWAPLAKSITLVYVGHAHMDMNWLWDWSETVEMVVNTLTTVDRLMEEFPEFCFSQSQTEVYDIVRRFSPDLFAKIAERVRRGQWEITANQWVEGDKNLASDESIVRHLLYSKQFFQENWSIAPEQMAMSFEPDTFGHPRGLPTVYRNAGIRWMYFCRGGPETTAFRWQAPDGSEVIAWNDFLQGYNSKITGDEVGAALRFYEQSGIRQFLKIYGVGDHGGGPTRNDLQRLMEMRSWPIFPTLKPARLADYFHGLEEIRETLPIIRGELNSVFPGCYTSQSETKTMNATNEAALRTSEGLWAMADLLGVSVPANMRSMREAWKDALFSQFHDILSGSGIPETYRYALGHGQDTKALALIAGQQAMAAIVKNIDTNTIEEAQTVLVIFNPLAWERCDVVEVDVYERFEPGAALNLVDAAGNAVPLQYSYDVRLGFPGHSRARICFRATVPGLGYAVYVLAEGDQNLSDALPDMTVQTRAEGHQTLTLSGKTMASLGLESLLDSWPKPWRDDYLPSWLQLFRHLSLSPYHQGFRVETSLQCVEAVAGVSGLTWSHSGSLQQVAALGALQWFREEPHGMSAWEIGPDLERHTVVGTRWKVTEVGPVRMVLHSQVKIGSSTISSSVTLYPDCPRVDWLLDIDWREFGTAEEGVAGLSIRFPLPSSDNDRAWFGQAMGSIVRPLPSRDVPAQGWTAKVGDGGAYVVYHPTRYGVSVSRDDITVTLLRASYEPDPYAEVGRHQIPISFEWVEGLEPDRWTREAMGRLTSLIGSVGDRHLGRLPVSLGALSLKTQVGVVIAVKPAEDGEGIIVRMRQDSEQIVPLEFTLAPGHQFDAARTSILEQSISDVVDYESNRLSVEVKPHGLATVRVIRAAE